MAIPNQLNESLPLIGIDPQLSAYSKVFSTGSGSGEDVDSRLTKVETDTADLKVEVDAHSTSLSDLDSTVGTLSGNVTTNTSNITSIDGRVTKNTDDITALDGRVSALETPGT